MSKSNLYFLQKKVSSKIGFGFLKIFWNLKIIFDEPNLFLDITDGTDIDRSVNST